MISFYFFKFGKLRILSWNILNNGARKGEMKNVPKIKASTMYWLS